MKIIKPSATYLRHDVTPYEFIEKIGRTCYKSEDKITEDSSKKFIENLVNRNHWAMLEHEIVYLAMSSSFMTCFLMEMHLENEPLTYFNVTHSRNTNILSGSFRSFHDLFEKRYQSETVKFIKAGLCFAYPLIFGDKYDVPKDYPEGSCVMLTREEFIHRYIELPFILYKHLTHTVKFVCDRGVSHEFVRHRPCSFAQESTRYCNYSLDKFGDEITVIEPCFFEKGSEKYGKWKRICSHCETHYFDLLDAGTTPQEARSVLPNSLKTELIITATEEEWCHIIDLRFKGTTGAPHPQMKEVMSLAIKDLVEESCGRIVS